MIMRIIDNDKMILTIIIMIIRFHMVIMIRL